MGNTEARKKKRGSLNKMPKYYKFFFQKSSAGKRLLHLGSSTRMPRLGSSTRCLVGLLRRINPICILFFMYPSKSFPTYFESEMTRKIRERLENYSENICTMCQKHHISSIYYTQGRR